MDTLIQVENASGYLMDLPSSIKLQKHSLPKEEAFDDHESEISDGESVNSNANHAQLPGFNYGLGRLHEEDKVNDLIKRKFVSCLGSLGKQTTVIAIHRNRFSDVMGQAKVQSFQIFTKAMEKKHGGNAHIKFAWFGASSRDEISSIMRHGFGHQINDNNGLYGSGIYLSPFESPLESVKNLRADEDGLRHLVLCRVILGKSEAVRPGSDRCGPSSEEFDSAVDTLSSPRKYIVWSTHMNRHILPEFVISFKAPSCLKGLLKTRNLPGMPTSPWMPFPTLISALSKFLPSASVALLQKCYKDHKEKKLSRQVLIQRVRQIAGDRLLIAVIKSFRTKQGKSTKQL